MSDQIMITPDQMRSRANEYRAKGEEMNELISGMDSLLEALTSESKGQAVSAFAESYQEMRPGFVSTAEGIKAFGDKCDIIANALEETDTSLAGSLR